MLKIGELAPNFSLPNQHGEMVSLNDFLGKNVVLYFYPKDSTSGCTKQALGFKDLYQEYMNKNTVIIGISKDSVKSHQRFIEKNQLPFILLSDENLDVLKLYQVWGEKKMYGKPYMGTLRTTYLINEKGIIVDVYEKVKPEENANEIICKLS